MPSTQIGLSADWTLERACIGYRRYIIRVVFPYSVRTIVQATRPCVHLQAERLAAPVIWSLTHFPGKTGDA